MQPQASQSLGPQHLITLRRFFLRLGIEASLEVLRESFAPIFTLSAVAQHLREHGIAARVHRIATEDLDGLTLPTLITLKENGCALLVAVDRFSVTVEDGVGATKRLSRSEADRILEGHALDVFPALPRLGGLVQRILDLSSASGPLQAAIVKLIVLSLLVNSFGLVTPIISRIALDDALPGGDRGLLKVIALGTIALAIHGAWTSWLRAKTVRYLEARLRHRTTQDLFEYTLRLPFSVLQDRDIGQSYQAISSGEMLSQLLVSQIIVPVLDGAMALGYLVILFASEGVIGAVTVAAAAILGVLGYVAGKLVAARNARLLEAQRRQQNELRQLLAGAPTIKVASAERAFVAKWLSALIDEQLAALDRQSVELGFQRFVDFIVQVVNCGVLVWSAQRCLAGEMSLGQVMAGLQASSSFLALSVRLATVPIRLGSARHHLDRVNELLATTGEPPIPTGASVKVGNSADAITFDDVWFRHSSDSPWIFERLNLSVKFGETLELSWPSGAGKTTLMRLVAGLYEPDRGTITVAGHAPRLARPLVAYLPQTTHLFNESVLENLRILSGGADFKRLMAAAEATGLKSLVEEWPMRFDTRVTAGGTNVSSGQRQLIVLTACVASPRPILLLDESMAHLDRLARARLRGADLFAGRTIVSIGHEPG